MRDFEDLTTARAWRQHLVEAGIEAVMTSDWPLDQFERGDIAVRVPPGSWSDAEEFLTRRLPQRRGLDGDPLAKAGEVGLALLGKCAHALFRLVRLNEQTER